MDDEESRAEIESIDLEIAFIEEQIDNLKSKRNELQTHRESLVASISTAIDVSNAEEPKTPSKDYDSETFAWSQQLKDLAKTHWGITGWRHKQLQVLNAALDQRDIFVIMPTGGGKSLCYQLPALVSSGITLVISPLLSLIRDQAFHLEEASIGVGMLTSFTTKEESKRIMDAMIGPTPLKSTSKANKTQIGLPQASGQQQYPPLKLIYVTPEKISKSKRFMNHLEKVYAAGRLSGIVIDECHCCSNQGHDFRPDYNKLGILRVVFPNTPIMALTATATPSVIQSVLTILHLSPLEQPGGTLLFEAPLFRNNLSYSVLTRPVANSDTYEFLARYIQKRHANSTGIIYCLSKKDTHIFAEGIAAASRGTITTSPYHADIEDDVKELVHEHWRTKRIQVVCATIAFGLGINHPNVRFVIHACMSKSLEGYYQESGRAGRDGLPADCLLLYRDQDASRLSTLCVSEPEGISNVYNMVRYAQDFKKCRHQAFNNHFSKLSSSTAAVGNQTVCGLCDNCKLDKNLIETENLQNDVRSLCLLLDRLKNVNERVTLNKLVEIWRGIGPLRILAKTVRDEHNVEVISKRSNKDDYDRIVNYLIVNDYLREDFHFTAYSTLAYIVNGRKAQRFLSDRLASLPSVNIEFCRDTSRIAGKNWGEPSELSKEPYSRNGSSSGSSLSGKRKKASSFEFQETIESEDDVRVKPNENDESSKRHKVVITLSDDDDNDNDDFQDAF